MQEKIGDAGLMLREVRFAWVEVESNRWILENLKAMNQLEVR